MNSTPRALASLLLTPILLLPACASNRTAAPAPALTPVQTQVYSVLGLENVIGRTSPAIETQFGRPELDIREGTARKLQFVGPACVLDVYFYPPKAGGEPIVTHVDARLPDGRDFDRASCVAALARRSAAP